MKGAITLPWVNINNMPINKMVIISGANQYFFRILKKSQMSFNKSMIVSITKKSFSNQFEILRVFLCMNCY